MVFLSTASDVHSCLFAAVTSSRGRETVICHGTLKHDKPHLLFDFCYKIDRLKAETFSYLFQVTKHKAYFDCYLMKF